MTLNSAARATRSGRQGDLIKLRYMLVYCFIDTKQ